jgi:iron complex transport system substrate-binding protein
MKHSGRYFFAVVSIAHLLCLVGSEGMAQERPESASRAPIPKRIVSLAPSVTETLFALGLGDRLVGVTTFCDYPPEAQRIPKIGDFINPNVEAILAKRPDLVIGVSGATDPDKAREMERLGLKVTLLSVSSLKEILRSIRLIAGVVGRQAAGERLVSSLQAQISRVQKMVGGAPRRSVLMVVGLQPLIAVGKKNFIDELITLAGGENITGSVSQPWLNLPAEYVVAKAPQVIIEAGMGTEQEESGKGWADLKSIPAVKERRIYSYRSDKILRPGPRFGEALEEIARLIHPECFAEANRNLEKGSGCEGPRP